MKKLLLAFVTLLSVTIHAQNFPLAWESKFDFTPNKINDFSNDGSRVLGCSESQIQMLDGTNGASLWRYKYKDKFTIKEFDRITWNDDAGLICLYNYDTKKEKGLQLVIDDKTGNELFRSNAYGGTDADNNYAFLTGMLDNYFESLHAFAVLNIEKSTIDMLDAKTGKVLWSKPAGASASVGKPEGLDVCYSMSSDALTYYVAKTGEVISSDKLLQYTETTSGKQKVLDAGVVYDEAKNFEIKLTYQKRILGGAKGSKRDITVTCTKISDGSYVWGTTFKGIVVSTLVTLEDLINISMVNGKVFVMYEGITVLDENDGKILWNAEFDNSDVSLGLKAKQEIGISAMPIVDGNAVYVVDLKTGNDIKKYDATTGKIIWESPKMGKDPVVPQMIVSNGVLIAQLGGRINVQTYIPGSGSNPDVYKSEYKFVGPFGLKAYDTNTGAVLWETSTMKDILKDKFSDGITNLVVAGNNVIVCSDKNLFSFDAKTGKANYATGMDAYKIGNPITLDINPADGKIYVICDKGIAAFTGNDGKNIYATKVGEIISDFVRGDNYFVWIGEDEFAGFDLETGKVKGKFKGQTHPKLTPDGNYLFNFDGSKIEKYKIN
jgi:hypothetical protein